MVDARSGQLGIEGSKTVGENKVGEDISCLLILGSDD